MKIHHQNVCGNKQISCLLQCITNGHTLVTFLYAYKNWKVKKKEEILDFYSLWYIMGVSRTIPFNSSGKHKVKKYSAGV